MARIFLYIVAGLTTLVVAAVAFYKIFEVEIWQFIFVPAGEFADKAPPPPPDYSLISSWYQYGAPKGVAALNPEGLTKLEAAPVDLFYVHPTSFLKKHAWNGAIDNKDAEAILANQFLPTHLSVFSGITDRIYAPRYRQAALGSFLTVSDSQAQALALAGEDVTAAFEQYLRNENGGRPFILAAHSQGAYHMLRLLRDRVAGTPHAARMIVAYVVGWPIGENADMAALPGISVCDAPGTTGCIMTWQTFASNGNPETFKKMNNIPKGLTGSSINGDQMMCVNPVNGLSDGETAEAEHKGSTIAVKSGDGSIDLLPLQPNLIAAACDEDGWLRIAPPPSSPFSSYILPGGDYHVYDFDLFFADIKTDAKARVDTFILNAPGE
ncbi:MAG: DUF3089 domain-containing protein [Pseudomonadota bacterium]